MIYDKEALRNGLRMKQSNFYKIVEIDLNTGLFYDVMNTEEEGYFIDIVSRISSFGKDNIHPDDLDRVMQFFDLDRIKEEFKEKSEVIVFYRRNIGRGQWGYACLEILKMDNYTEEDPIAILYVRNVQRHVAEFREQFRSGE